MSRGMSSWRKRVSILNIPLFLIAIFYEGIMMAASSSGAVPADNSAASNYRIGTISLSTGQWHGIYGHASLPGIVKHLT